MSAAPDSTALPIDVVSDVVCPWCWIGKRRLEEALARRASSESVRWHPFELNPDIPAGGVDRRAYLEHKFGGPDRARQIYERVMMAGRDAGIEFQFDRIARQPNTRNAHRLIDWVQRTRPEVASAQVERLFKAYFIEGVDIGDVAELARLAGEVGVDADQARAYLDSASGQDEVAAAEAGAHRLGISGVPFFIFNQRLAVSGAQPAEVLLDAITQSLEKAESAT